MKREDWDHKAYIMMQQVLYIVQLPNEEGEVTCTLYSTLCTMICLVIPILSFLLLI